VGFEVFQKSSAPVSKVPTVTVQRRGIMSMNRASHRLIGEPEFVELLWDAERQVIGLRPTDSSNPNAYPVRSQGSGDKGPLLVAGTMFTRYYDINTDESRRWVPEVEDGVLCVHMTRDSQSVTSNRSRRTPAAASG